MLAPPHYLKKKQLHESLQGNAPKLNLIAVNNIKYNIKIVNTKETKYFGITLYSLSTIKSYQLLLNEDNYS